MTDPPPELRGDLVTLRPTVGADKDDLVRIRRTEEVWTWWRGDDLEAEFDEDLADDETVHLTIVRNGSIVGLIQFHEEADPAYRHAGIDIYVDPAHHRQGIGADAIRVLAAHLFDDLGHHRLTIDPAADNAAAVRCYESVGFRPVGIMRQYSRRADGTWEDGLLMDMLASDR